MWYVESSMDLRRSPADIWRLYSDPTTWSSWGHSTARATTEGALAEGSLVTIEPTRGPKQRVRVVAFEPERRLETELRLPGARMRFSYVIEDGTGTARVRHGIEMDGPLSGVYGLFMRRSNERKLAEETRRLSRELGGST